MKDKFTAAMSRLLPTISLIMLIACNNSTATTSANEATPMHGQPLAALATATREAQLTEIVALAPTAATQQQDIATVTPPAEAFNALKIELNELILAAANTSLAAGVTNVSVLLLEQDGPATTWAAHTAGFLTGEEQHTVWLYRHEPAGWQQLGQNNLTYIKSLLPDSLKQTEVDGQGFWLQLSGGLEAGGSCYALLHYDEFGLRNNIDHCHSTFASPGVTDLNLDGVADLRLNNSDDFILCPVCGVSQPDYDFLTWSEDGFWQEVTLTFLEESSLSEFKDENNALVTLAQAGLWQEAARLAITIERPDPIAKWNITIIESYGEALLQQISTSPFPLLTYLYFGDYEAAVAELRPYPPEAIFVDRPEIIFGSPAENNITGMANAIVATTAKALAHDPDLVEAQFLRGWALYLLNPGDPNAVQAIEQADRLGPTDPLFADTLFYFYNHLNYSP